MSRTSVVGKGNCGDVDRLAADGVGAEGSMLKRRIEHSLYIRLVFSGERDLLSSWATGPHSICISAQIVRSDRVSLDFW